MKETKLKTWILWAVILFSVGLAADYFFWHLLLGQQREEELIEKSAEESSAAETPATPAGKLDAVDTGSFISESRTEAASPPPGGNPKDTFLETLRICAPEIAAQAIATPEALLEYLQKSVGIAQETVSIENYHLTLADGSLRRVHVIGSESSKNPQSKEIRLYKLDSEGYPERLPLSAEATLEDLLAQGKLQRHELRAELKLKDGSAINLEKHDQKVFEFQFNNHGRILSCRQTVCQCP